MFGCQDFNTATLPHEKYYNLDIYERRKAAKEARKNASNTQARPLPAHLQDLPCVVAAQNVCSTDMFAASSSCV